MTLLRPGACVVAALVLGAGGWARGQEAAVPLEESKRSLQEMRKERAAPAPSGSLREAAPAIQAPDIVRSQGAAVSPPPRSREDAARQVRARREWLADGVRSLETGRGRELSLLGEGEAADPDEKIDPADPNYLLKVYEREARASREGRESRSSAAPEREQHQASASPPVDPLEPFLREWLRGSPVESVALGARASAAPGVPSSVRGEPVGVNSSGPTWQPPTAERSPVPGASSLGGGNRLGGENPFLQGLAPVNTRDPGLAVAPGGPLSPGGLDLPASVRPAAAPAPSPAPPARAAPPDRRPPPSPLQENEKYFPQQRKF